MAIKGLQVFEQYAPGHAVDRQVMDHQQQALLTLRAVDQYGTYQRALLLIKAALGLLEQVEAVLQIRHGGMA